MRVIFHGVTVEIDDKIVEGLSMQCVKAGLLKYACDIHETYVASPVDFDPPVLVAGCLTVERVGEFVFLCGSIRQQNWILQL